MTATFLKPKPSPLARASALEARAAQLEDEYERQFYKLTVIQRAQYIDQIEKLLAEAQACKGKQ